MALELCRQIFLYTVWCYITMTSSPDDTVALVFGYEVWTWLILTGIMISIIGYLITHLCKKKGYCCYQQQPELKSLNKVRCTTFINGLFSIVPGTPPCTIIFVLCVKRNNGRVWYGAMLL